MKKLIALVALALPLLVVPPAHAAVVLNEIEPLNDFEVYIPCANETVTLNGSLHVLITTTVNDVRLIATVHLQSIGLVGEDTAGRTYHAVGIRSHEASIAFFRNGQFESSSKDTWFFIGTSGAPSYKVHELLHVTVDGSGQLVGVVRHLWITCQ
jgi:hypothetical protein